MADKRTILELDIDTEAIIAKSAQLKVQLDSLRENQDKLKKSGDTSSEAYVKNAATISKVSAEYRINQQQLSNLSTVNSKYLTIQEKLSLAIDKEIISIGAARSNNTELLKIRNELNINTKEGAKAAELINEKLDENNKFIKENVSAYEKQKINIGNYKEDIKSALEETGAFNGTLGDLGKALSGASGVFGLLKKDFGESFTMIRNSAKGTEELSGAQKAMAIATNIGTGAMRIFTLALAATGIGLIIAAVALLIGYFKTFDPVVDTIEQGMAALGAAVRVVQQALAALLSGDFSAFDNLSGKMYEAAKAAATLKEAQQDLADAQAIQSVANKRQEAEIARLMLQSKDRGKTEAERIALLQKAEAINQQNFAKNASLADKELANAIESSRIKGQLSANEVGYLQKQGLAYAYKLLNAGKITDEEVEMLKKAEEAKLDIYNRATSEQEKIQNRQNALIEKQEAESIARAKKAEEDKQKSLDYAVTKSKAQLDLFISQQGFRKKSIQEELDFAEKVRDKKLQIAQQEFNASKKTEADKLQLQITQNNAKEDFLLAQANAVIANADHELQILRDKNQLILDNDKFLSEELLQQKKEALANIAIAEAEYQAERFSKGLINEQEYNDAINAINEENRLTLVDLEEQRKAEETEKQLIDLENTRATVIKNSEEDLAARLAQLEIQKKQELANAEKTGADKNLIVKKYGKAEQDIRGDVETAKLVMMSNALGQAKSFLKEHTTAFKALAVAEATINTYVAASNAIKDYPYPIGGIFAGLAIAQGLLQVGKIVGVKLAKGGRVRGKGTSTSDSIPAHLSNGETVINAKSSEMFSPLLSAINVAGGGVAFAKGEVPYPIAEKNVYVPSNNQSTPIDYDLLAGKIAEANKMLPPNKIVLEEFNSANDQYKKVIDGANL